MSTMRPLVSVVIPVYNMEAYLVETLDSILASDYPALEIVVMDDGSRDNSLALARQYAEKYPSIYVYTQKNAGVCVARNQAIAKAKGEYILPVDADNRITPTFISSAVQTIASAPDIKAVCCRAEFFGARQGEWKLPPFSLHLLARKNMMDTCALYRRSDWERIGGYCEDIIAREDWEFWIAMLKDGGRVVRLPEVGLYYRVRPQSKRVSDRALKHHVIDTLNRRHPEFFERELGGPLRYRRSWSRVINFFSKLYKPRTFQVAEEYTRLAPFVYALPQEFATSGKTIYKGRNELKAYEREGQTFVVKSYQKPHWINRIAYTWFRKSKAARAYDYALLLREHGIGSPEPVGYITQGYGFLMAKSYFVSRKSECPYTFRDLQAKAFPRQREILEAIARVTAKMHELGYLHRDYSAGNILFRDDKEEIAVELIDLNRMSFGHIGMEKGCRNFERLSCSDEMLRVLAETYAAARGFDAEACFRIMCQAIQEEEERRKK